MVIKYTAGYKYQLAETYSHILPEELWPKQVHRKTFIYLNCAGLLLVYPGYAWDGPSGPTFDTENFMRGSLVHDVLYQLIREKYLEPAQRAAADKELRRICLEDGMSNIRAWWIYRAVTRFAAGAACPASIKPIYTAGIKFLPRESA